MKYLLTKKHIDIFISLKSWGLPLAILWVSTSNKGLMNIKFFCLTFLLKFLKKEKKKVEVMVEKVEPQQVRLSPNEISRRSTYGGKKK